jgi:Protein of unknown function (DUF3723)
MAERDLPSWMGSAKVQVSELAPENGKDLRAQVDQKNVQRLVGIFKLIGCCDAEEKHRIPALVRKDELERVPATSKEDSTQLPKLEFGHTIPFLRGKHRLVAAAEYLPVNDQWWTVELYDAGECTNGRVCFPVPI